MEIISGNDQINMLLKNPIKMFNSHKKHGSISGYFKFSWRARIGCSCVSIKRFFSLQKGRKKPRRQKEKCLLSAYANSPLFLAVTKDMTSHIVQGPRFMRSRFVSGR